MYDSGIVIVNLYWMTIIILQMASITMVVFGKYLYGSIGLGMYRNMTTN